MTTRNGSGDDIVVTGLGIHCSIGRDLDEFRASLLAGNKGFSKVARFELAGFRNDRAGVVGELPEVKTRHGQRESRLLRAATEEALGAGCLENVDGRRVGIAVGTSLGGFGGFVHWLLSATDGAAPDPEHVFEAALNPRNRLRGRDVVLNIPPVQLAGELAREYGFSAGISASCTACSAGANSLAIAVDALRRGRADVMLAGGVDPINEMTVMGFNALMAISPTEPAPFDRNRSGLLVGEGAGMMTLERRAHAQARGATVFAELAGYGLANDAYHVTQPHPEGAGAIVAMRKALARAQVEPREIGYVNTHGTGTRHNDLMELTALQGVFGEYAARLPISSIKSMIGHTLGAAGAIEAIATVLALHDDFLPPNLNYSEPIEGFTYRIITTAERGVGLRHAMSNSFAFGGNCASLVFSRA